MKKSRNQLKKFGMLDEFDAWKETALLKPAERFSVGSRVRFTKNFSGVNWPEACTGTLGRIVKTQSPISRGCTTVRIDNTQLIPLWKHELDLYLEEI